MKADEIEATMGWNNVFDPCADLTRLQTLALGEIALQLAVLNEQLQRKLYAPGPTGPPIT